MWPKHTSIHSCSAACAIMTNVKLPTQECFQRHRVSIDHVDEKVIRGRNLWFAQRTKLLLHVLLDHHPGNCPDRSKSGLFTWRTHTAFIQKCSDLMNISYQTMSSKRRSGLMTDDSCVSYHQKHISDGIIAGASHICAAIYRINSSNFQPPPAACAYHPHTLEQQRFCRTRLADFICLGQLLRSHGIPPGSNRPIITITSTMVRVLENLSPCPARHVSLHASLCLISPNAFGNAMNEVVTHVEYLGQLSVRTDYLGLFLAICRNAGPAVSSASKCDASAKYDTERLTC